MPPADYQHIAQLQQRCLQHAVAVNKSELVRAGLRLLASLDDETLLRAIAQIEKVKVGRRSAPTKYTTRQIK